MYVLMMVWVDGGWMGGWVGDACSFYLPFLGCVLLVVTHGFYGCVGAVCVVVVV